MNFYITEKEWHLLSDSPVEECWMCVEICDKVYQDVDGIFIYEDSLEEHLEEHLEDIIKRDVVFTDNYMYLNKN